MAPTVGPLLLPANSQKANLVPMFLVLGGLSHSHLLAHLYAPYAPHPLHGCMREILAARPHNSPLDADPRNWPQLPHT
jgi:hypothetical protein